MSSVKHSTGSPRAAAMSISESTVNGWTFWEARLPGQAAAYLANDTEHHLTDELLELAELPSVAPLPPPQAASAKDMKTIDKLLLECFNISIFQVRESNRDTHANSSFDPNNAT